LERFVSSGPEGGAACISSLEFHADFALDLSETGARVEDEPDQSCESYSDEDF
jgi:hypothetical protein